MISIAMAFTDYEDFCLFFFLLLISTFVLYYLIRTYLKPSSAVRHLPSPPSLPIIGHLHLIGSSFPLSCQALARRYGSLMQLRILSSNFVVVSQASIAKEIFKTHDQNFSSRFEMGPMNYNIYAGTGFIVSQFGEYWRFMRKLCMTELFSGSQLDRFNRIREKEIEKLLKSLMKLGREGKPCDLNVELETLTNNLICKMAMGKRFNKDDNEAKKMRRLVCGIMDSGAKLSVSEVFGVLKKIDLFGHGKRLKDAQWEYDRAMEKIMKEYEENLEEVNEEKDVMDILLETYRNENAQVKLTRTQIKHFILLFMASIDTESAAIQWTMAELIKRPKIFNKLREEIRSVVKSRRLVNPSDISDLPYLEAVIKESLRLHPPSAIWSRECTKDCTIDGFDIKAKTKLLINAYAIMRDPDVWQDDPEEFMPERFLRKDTRKFDENLMEMRRHECGFIPFGGGRRGCIGSAHVYSLMHSTIGALVQCFNWKVEDGKKIDINVSNGFSGNLASPLMCYPITHFNPY